MHVGRYGTCRASRTGRALELEARKEPYRWVCFGSFDAASLEAWT